jgi:hypothetical protein
MGDGLAGKNWGPFLNQARKLADRSRCVNQEATKVIARVKRIAGVLGVPSRSTLGEGRVDIAALELTMIELPGVGEDGRALGKRSRMRLGASRRHQSRPQESAPCA